MRHKHKTPFNEINFREYPYRGCFTKAAKKLGITPQNIRSAYSRRNPDVINAVTKEVQKVNRIIRDSDKIIEEVNGNPTINN